MLRKLVFVLIMFLSVSVYSLSIKVDKLRIYEKVKPGDILEGVINVINDKETPSKP